MTKQIITMELELDCNPTPYHYQDELQPNHIYYLDIPRIDLTQYTCIRIKVRVDDKKEEP